jgi:hypothetical protein
MTQNMSTKSNLGKPSVPAKKAAVKPKVEAITKYGELLPSTALTGPGLGNKGSILSIWPGYRMAEPKGRVPDLMTIAYSAQVRLLAIQAHYHNNIHVGRFGMLPTYPFIAQTLVISPTMTSGLPAAYEKHFYPRGKKPKIFEYFTPRAAYYPASQRRFHQIRRHFNLQVPKELKKPKQLAELTRYQRLEIAYYIACNYWLLVNDMGTVELYLADRYLGRRDYDNIVAYVIPETAKIRYSSKVAKSTVFIDAIPIPRESYHQLMVEIDTVFKYMGKPISPATAYLNAIRGSNK